VENRISKKRVDLLFLAITLCFGLIQVWACRYELSPDSMDYLDIAREIAGGHWSALANGYWGTLNSVFLAPLFRLHPSPERELLLAHTFELVILVFSFFTFRLFLDSLLSTARLQSEAEEREKKVLIPEWSIRVLGYCLFLWSSLVLVPVFMIGPDLLVTAFVYLSAAMLLRLRPDSPPLRLIGFGVTLGVGYWAKAIMFPISLVFLATSIFKVRQWRLSLIAIFAFGVTAAPLILALSLPRGRFTFGDSGLLNYSTMVSPGGRDINWQGSPAGSGQPKHPTRQINLNPPVYEFNGPIAGTYPPSYDPSYWNEGRRSVFNLRLQLITFGRHVPPVLELFLASQPGITGAFIFLLLWSLRGFLERLKENWELIAVSLPIIILYMLVHFETRFVGAFVVFIWLSAFMAIRLPSSADSGRIGGLCMIGLAVAMLISIGSNTAKKIVNGFPDSASEDLNVAYLLKLPPHSPIAVIGNGNYSYWAHFANLRIVADIMSPDEEAFWLQSKQARMKLYDAFRTTGAKWIIARPPAFLEHSLDGWQRVGSSGYYFFPLYDSANAPTQAESGAIGM
jgi:hypothetical protein